MFGLFSSTYDKLKNAESKLPRPSGKMPPDVFIEKFVKPRAELKRKVEDAYNRGKITKSQHDELVRTIQKGALPNFF